MLNLILAIKFVTIFAQTNLLYYELEKIAITRRRKIVETVIISVASTALAVSYTHLVKVVDFPPHVVVGDVGAAGVGAQPHRDTGLQAGAGALHDPLKDHRAVVLLHLRHPAHRPVEEGVGQRGGEGRDLAGPPLFEEGEDRLVRLGPVLDGVHPVFQGHPHPLGALHVLSLIHL